MLKVILLFLFTFGAWASEPDRAFISKGDRLIEVNFSKLSPVKLKAINYHPNFIKEGEVFYQGFRVRDILKNMNVKNEQSIVLVGKTGQFSLELSGDELLGDDVIIATHKDGVRFTAEGNGNQIIYGPKTVAKFPHLKTRQYWCWWVRSFLFDNGKAKAFSIPSEKKTLSSVLPFPTPYGISSRGQYSPQTLRDGNVLNVMKARTIKIHQLNGNIIEHPIKNGVTYFVSKTKVLKEGGVALYALEVEKDKVVNFISNNFYLRDIEVIK